VEQACKGKVAEVLGGEALLLRVVLKLGGWNHRLNIHDLVSSTKRALIYFRRSKGYTSSFYCLSVVKSISGMGSADSKEGSFAC